MIGLATSSLYFSNLLTCAKIFPQHKGLAISLPITCYGLSALLGSQLLKLDYFHMGREIYKDSPAVDVLSISSSSDSLLNLVKVFKFFAILYLIVGILSFISSSIVIVEQDAIFANIEDMMETAYNNENSSLLSNELTIQRSIDPPNHKQRYIKFLKDVSAWILLVSLILNTGPLESYQNNLSSIISLMNPNNKSIATVSSDLPNKVSLLATSSTISRLVLGVSIDFLQSRKIGIVWLLVLIILMGALGQWFNNVALNGIAYGGLFTVYPTIIASVWGIDIMGSTWGSFMVAPAIGSIAYSLFYGRIADSDKNGMIFYFQITSFSLFISSILVLVACRVWYRRGQFV
ncbi:MCH1 [Candida oxycetoniae]|uniref:Probable transporter MCH1 n=1 Tax=Candida oxycetoniae TaxID=497107 RepID=A0AAI9SUE4_9ASCO|nr:MCH1 [Candida oxycetoniae]KAI3402869.2 MCH1 [Candida oxycetoniae]